MTSRGTKYWNSGAIPLIAPEILGDIITEVADVGIVVGEDGSVLSVLVNPASSLIETLDGLEGKNLGSALTRESVEKFETRLKAFLDSGTAPRGVELNHADSSGQYAFPVRYTFHRIGPDGAILLMGRDLRPVAEMQQQLVDAQLALERDYEAQRESDTRFRVIMEATRDAVVFISLHTGLVTEANTQAAELLGVGLQDLEGKAFTPTLEYSKTADLLEKLSSEAVSDQPSRLTVRARRSGEDIQIAPTLFRAAGQRLLLCRLDPVNESDRRGDRLGKNLAALYEACPDAIVFTDQSGDILSTNDSFLTLVNIANDLSVKSRSLSEFLQRESVDLRVMIENAARSGRMRVFPTKITGPYGTPRSVEISVTAIKAGDHTLFGFVFRETSRLENVTPVNQPVNDNNVRSVMELVGSATLKEIVAETTNVVERMCIETAVELTMNNRVAAAEMLGLSRQSLYVKLRKYDLLSREG